MSMGEGCGLCGGQLDDHNVRVTVTFAAGLRNGNHFTQVPYQLKDWPVCWTCLLSPKGEALRLALNDEYNEPLIEAAGGCHVACTGDQVRGGGRLRRLLSLRAGSRGEPQGWARCPVCFSSCTVERTAA